MDKDRIKKRILEYVYENGYLTGQNVSLANFYAKNHIEIAWENIQEAATELTNDGLLNDFGKNYFSLTQNALEAIYKP